MAHAMVAEADMTVTAVTAAPVTAGGMTTGNYLY
jgi:hypothetical protein